ncbi:carbohydrate ABC transporter substrate-binding protein (CUT1 family) [Fontibacillus phaseoli]|uniref:Carbohydrate ABC transporter substrate-binding protein (CUT1 family) n=1 Tax=Fontibacillus phaseoli TaxID=1416533 RepID=A0A369BLU4_9BACL|nr:extracellular solute-binding protein [Fontibacillus phaseoli]RCX21566.1 carbohydrate ABC transporter substrate-binding protein (CUT1 family) [Fontibacillus phaseoli]
MKTKIFQKVGLLGAATLLLLASVGCNSEQSGKDDNGNSKLIIYSESATYEGPVDGYMGKYLEDKANVALNVVPNSVGGSSRFETKLATGDLGNLIVFTSAADFKKAIDAGAVLDLKDELKNLPNIARFSKAVDRVKNSFGGVYGIPTGVSASNEVNQIDPVVIPSLRFDYYQELGTPEVKDYWDFYDVIEKMVKAHPTTEGGDTFYGLSLFSEWDGNSVGMAQKVAEAYGYTASDGVNKYSFIMPHATEDKVENLLADDSYYLKSLQWFNKFYQNGMLDEDSVSQTWADFLKKAEKGQSAIWMFGYMGDLNFNPMNQDLVKQGKGYKRIPFANLKAAEAKSSTVGSSWFWAVSSSTENKEAALKLLDFFYSDEGALAYHLGPKGLLWDINEKGEPIVTELGKAPYETAVPEEWGGGKVDDTLKTMFNGAALDGNSISPILNAPMNKTTWKSYLQDNATMLDKNWTKHYDGVLSAKEYMVKNGRVASYTVVDVPNFQYDDLLAVKRDQVGSIIKELSWKMIYAKNNDEFEALKKEMIQKAKSLGYDECVAFEEEAAKVWFKARKAAN